MVFSIVDSYYHKDTLPPRPFGTRKQLKNLDTVNRVTNCNNIPQPVGPARRNGLSAGGAGFRARIRGYHNDQYHKGQFNEPNNNESNKHGPK